MNKRLLILGILILNIACFTFAAEQTETNFKLKFDETVSTWEMHYNSNGKVSPLLENRDPSTSYSVISVDGKNYRLKKNSFFNQHIEEYPGLMVVHWSNRILHITQSVQLDNSIKGFKITLSIRNLSKNYTSVGLKQIFDTFNNTEGADFLINGNIPLDSEQSWKGSDIPEYWGTNPEKNEDLRLTFTPLGDRKPDQIIFANWKRISDSDWNFNVRNGRDFSLLPYSINDSAAGVYYNPVSIPPGTEIAIQYALTSGGPVARPSETTKTETTDVAIPKASPVSDKSLILSYSFQYDLDMIDDFINEINTLLQLDNPVYTTQVEYFQGELEKLKQKLSHYEDIQ